MNKINLISKSTFVIHSVVMLFFIAVSGIIIREFWVFFMFIGNFILWWLYSIVSHDFYFDDEKIIVDNRLRPCFATKELYYKNIKKIKILNIQYVRPYQRIEIYLNIGKLIKYASSGIKEKEFMKVMSMLDKIGIVVDYECD